MVEQGCPRLPTPELLEPGQRAVVVEAGRPPARRHSLLDDFRYGERRAQLVALAQRARVRDQHGKIKDETAADLQVLNDVALVPRAVQRHLTATAVLVELVRIRWRIKQRVVSHWGRPSVEVRKTVSSGPGPIFSAGACVPGGTERVISTATSRVTAWLHFESPLAALPQLAHRAPSPLPSFAAALLTPAPRGPPEHPRRRSAPGTRWPGTPRSRALGH
jgi:hypothetical protein